MHITYIDTDQNLMDETVNYWFEVDGVSFCISDSNGETQLLDCDGCPDSENEAIFTLLDSEVKYRTLMMQYPQS